MNKEDVIISLLKEIDENIANVNDNEGTNANLEELTITNNGEYTPQEGVDGFSKVVAEFDTSSLPKVKVLQFKVTNECINDDGIWDGENLIDTSECTSLEGTFRMVSLLKKLDVSNWDTSKVTNMLSTFSYCSSLQYLDVSNWDTSNVTNMNNMFRSCTQLQHLDVSHWDTSKVTNMFCLFADCILVEYLDVSNWDVSNVTNMGVLFTNCQKIKTLDVSNWDVSKVTHMSEIFAKMPLLESLDLTKWDISNVTSMESFYQFRDSNSLRTIIGNKTISDVITNNISAWKGLKVSINISPTILERASLRALINGLADLTGSDTQTLTLGETLIAKLTEEDIAIATAKNWTLS